MMKHVMMLALAAAMITFIGCEDPEPIEGTLRLGAKAMYDGNSMIIGDIYTDNNDRPINIEQFRTYISSMKAVKDDGTIVHIKAIDQINFAESWFFDATLPAGDYYAITFGIGVPESINADQDPAQYPNDHVLGFTGNNGMFWSWNSGYIFTKFEGKTALDGDENSMTDPYAFHVGTDNFYEEFTFNVDFEIDEARTDVDIIFNCEQFLEGTDDSIDLATDNITHTADNIPLAERFMALFRDGINVELAN
ncbi:MAG: hypothetical protein MK081_14610 [Flavobacteriales bacterium]|nr:hypothetical protein [Flavobacteriales bacterium]